MRHFLVALLLLWPSLAWAAFDMGFDYRGTAGGATDPAYGTPVLGEQYPHTYTNANGDSINAGWVGTPLNHFDRAASPPQDPRLAGMNYSGGATDTFQVDLASGSNPGAGTYTVDLADGDAATGETLQAKLFDNLTLLFDTGSQTTVAGQFIDATGALVTASTNWTGTTVSETFATTTCKLTNTSPAADTIAHFRLTKAGGGPPPQRSLTGVGL